MPRTTTLAEAPIGGGVAAQVGAEGQRPPQHVVLRRRRRPGRGRRRSGLIVATYGMLSTIADSTAEPHSSSIVASHSRPVDGVGGGLARPADDAGVDQRADHDEQAGEERPAWATRRPWRPRRRRAWRAASSSRAPSERDHRRLAVQHRVQHERGHHQRRARPGSARAAAGRGWPRAPRSAMTAAARSRVVAERAAEQPPAQPDEHDQQHDDQRGQVHQEVVEASGRPGWR